MALYNHLFARKHGGKWVLRIEDTDAVSQLEPRFFFSKNDLTALGADKNCARLSGRDKVCAGMGRT